MTISYAITVCNEFVEIQRLLTFLTQNIRKDDEIVVLLDLTKNTPTTELVAYLHKLSNTNQITLVEDNFNNHFADWKNKLTKACTKEFIYQIDADEMIDPEIVEFLPQILSDNDVDAYLVPRINTVEGITQEHIQRWGWRIDSKNRINFPDNQMRIYRNNGKIKWKNKVHEVLTGYKTLANLPTDEVFCLIHNKTITKQENQNNYYNTL
jgi:GT2 family glycosyltransferase